MGKPTASAVSISESIGYGSKPGELKYLSTRRNRNQTRDSLSSDERTGISPKALVCVVERSGKSGHSG